MNISTLQKCVEELKKETPNISYVLGMLETVIEMDRSSIPFVPIGPSYPTQPYPLSSMPNTYPGATAQGSGLVSDLSDEEITARRYARGPIGEIQ